MITRRLFGTGVLATVAGTAGGAEVTRANAAGAQRDGDRDLRAIADELRDLKDLLERQRLFSEIADLREAQKLFLRQNGKLPDYIEVGSDIWFRAYDWHVRWQQPLQTGRDGQNRHTLLLLHTTLILRPDVLGTYMSLPYDAGGTR
jgi:hypothetical protein